LQRRVFSRARRNPTFPSSFFWITFFFFSPLRFVVVFFFSSSDWLLPPPLRWTSLIFLGDRVCTGLLFYRPPTFRQACFFNSYSFSPQGGQWRCSFLNLKSCSSYISVFFSSIIPLVRQSGGFFDIVLRSIPLSRCSLTPRFEQDFLS